MKEFSRFQRPLQFYGEDVIELVISPKLSLLPKFTVDLQDGSSFYIRKKLTLLRDKYDG